MPGVTGALRHQPGTAHDPASDAFWLFKNLRSLPRIQVSFLYCQDRDYGDDVVVQGSSSQNFTESSPRSPSFAMHRRLELPNNLDIYASFGGVGTLPLSSLSSPEAIRS